MAKNKNSKTKRPTFFVNSTRGALNGTKTGGGWESCDKPARKSSGR